MGGLRYTTSYIPVASLVRLRDRSDHNIIMIGFGRYIHSYRVVLYINTIPVLSVKHDMEFVKLQAKDSESTETSSPKQELGLRFF